MHRLPRFWIRKEFMEHHAKHIKTSDQAVYMALSFHVNKQRRTFVGYRRIADLLNMNKDTVMRCVKRLIAYGLVRRLEEQKNGEPSKLELTTVLFDDPKPSDSLGPKEFKKELLKEDKRFRKNNGLEPIGKIMEKNGKMSGLEQLRQKMEIMRQGQPNNPKNSESKCHKCHTIKKGRNFE